MAVDFELEAPKVSASLMSRYSRDQLYEEVWTEPVWTVAERYKVSDVAWQRTVESFVSQLLTGATGISWRPINQSSPARSCPTSKLFRTCRGGGEGAYIGRNHSDSSKHPVIGFERNDTQRSLPESTNKHGKFLRWRKASQVKGPISCSKEELQQGKPPGGGDCRIWLHCIEPMTSSMP
jgi:hypothetical protein